MLLVLWLIWLAWILMCGLIVGALARWLMPGDDTMSFLHTSLVGIAGSLLGGILNYVVGSDYVPMWMMSTMGAILILVGVRVIKKRLNEG